MSVSVADLAALRDNIGGMSSPPQPPVDPRDLIEREPPGWGMLPVAIGVVVLVFFIAIPWLLMKMSR